MNTLPVIIPLRLPSPAAMRLLDEQRAEEYQRDLVQRIVAQQEEDARLHEAWAKAEPAYYDDGDEPPDDYYDERPDYRDDYVEFYSGRPFDFNKLRDIRSSDTHYGHYTIIDTAIDMTTSYDPAVLIEFLRECIDLVPQRVEQINRIGRRHDDDDDR